ncbi:unnamed protein product [Calypogeia fissa]
MVHLDPPLTQSRSRALASAVVTAAATASSAPPPAPAPAPPQDALLEKANRLQDLLYYNWIVPKESSLVDAGLLCTVSQFSRCVEIA